MNTPDIQPSLQAAAELHQQGKLQQALAIYQSLVKGNANASVYYLMGNCLAQMQQFEQAADALKKSLALDSLKDDVYLNLAICQEGMGDIGDAIETLEKALALFPSNKRFHNRYGDILLTRGQADLASSHFKQAIELDKSFLPAYINLAKAYEKLDQLASGVETLRAAGTVADAPIIQNNLANLLRQQGEYNEANQLLQSNISRGLLLSESYHNLALLEQDQGKFSLARQHYQLALQHNPHNLLSQWNLTLLDLMQGNWSDSLEKYRTGLLINERPRLPPTLKQWSGESLDDKSLLIVHEQGIGEEILFSSTYHLLHGKNVKITALCSARLKNLFGHSFPWVKFKAKDELNTPELSRFDYAVLAGDLPWILNISPQQQLHTRGFLKTNGEMTNKSNEKRIGLSWRGGKNQHEQRKRSLMIDQLSELLKTSNYTFVNLQHDINDHELDFLQSTAVRLELHPEIDLKNDIESLAELIQSLDAVVCCTNSISHLAGALNTPTFMLTPLSPTWYWLAEGTQTPWYANVHFIRQKEPNSWDREIAELTQQLNIQLD